jgi:hypothetical protein
MRRTQGFATTFAIALVLSPIRIGGQKEPVIRELGAMVPTAAPVELATEPVTVRIAMRSDARAQIEAAMAPLSKAKLALTVERINYDKTPDVSYEVYIDLPKGEKTSYKSVYFIGNLAFFQPHAGTAEHVSVASFDITRAVRELRSFKLWKDEEVSVTFVMSWLVDRNGRQLPVPPGVRLRFGNVKAVAITPQ